ncbi:MAG: iron ABC transporter permease [Candidatus Caldatribacteriota bacterium]
MVISFLGIVSILGVSLFALNFGVASIKPKVIFSILSHRLIEDTPYLIIWQLRIPRIIMAGLAGIALSTVGAAFQGILRNPLADPYILGVSAGAALGACLGIALEHLSGYYLTSYLPLFAFLGALFSLFLVYRSSKISLAEGSIGLLLAGVAITFLFSALITILLAFSKSELHSMLFWLMGDLSTASWHKISIITIPVLLGCILLFTSSLDLNALALGEEEALHLGINTGRLRIRIFIIGSLIIASVVSFTGIIGFVGLIIPHITRLLVGPDHRTMLPASAFLGAVFLILCDTLARFILAPSEIPIGAITAAIGAPLFIYLLKRGYQ